MAEQKFLEAKAAYEVLSDAERRAEYDRGRAEDAAKVEVESLLQEIQAAVDRHDLREAVERARLLYERFPKVDDHLALYMKMADELACALYQQGKASAAKEYFQLVACMSKDEDQRTKAKGDLKILADEETAASARASGQSSNSSAANTTNLASWVWWAPAAVATLFTLWAVIDGANRATIIIGLLFLVVSCFIVVAERSTRPVGLSTRPPADPTGHADPSVWAGAVIVTSVSALVGGIIGMIAGFVVFFIPGVVIGAVTEFIYGKDRANAVLTALGMPVMWCFAVFCSTSGAMAGRELCTKYLRSLPKRGMGYKALVFFPVTIITVLITIFVVLSVYRAWRPTGTWGLSHTPARFSTGAAQLPHKFQVAMILPGSESDHGWNQMAREGLDRIRAELGAETKLVTNVKPSEFTSQINYFAADGFDVIICHGGEFEKDVAKAAAAYPKTRFIVGGCPTDVPGAVAVEFLARDASYLVGVVAANVSKAKTVAFVGAMPVPTLQACYDGMKEGVAVGGTGGADVKILPALWTDSWDSPTRAKEKAESAIAAGADVIYQNVDAAAQGVFEAAKEAGKPAKPVFAFGCNSNQNSMSPQIVLGSVVIDVQRAYMELARDAHAGALKNGAMKLGLGGGYVDLVLNDGHAAVTAALKEKVSAARKRLIDKSSK